MTLKEFNTLSDHDKYDTTFQKGDFIDYWINGTQRFALYAVYKFFVEIEFNTIENKIQNLKSFEEGILLNKYAYLRKKN